ncbi:MAG: RecX family transcriptional regulator [Anaerolineae bacterium]|nr:RecX family transcriptional regulator [Anaerolineae bacterium]
MTSGTVTAIRRQKRRRDRVNVYLDHEFAFSLQRVVAARLSVGQMLDVEQIADLRKRDGIERAHERALHYLSYRPRSEREVRRYLQRKEFGEEAIDEVLARLKRTHLVDDLAFARSWVENRESLRPRGPWMLKAELRQKGLSDQIIDAVLVDLDEEASALKASEAAVRRYARLSEQVFRRRLWGYLQRRGFGYDVCRSVVNRRWVELEARRESGLE